MLLNIIARAAASYLSLLALEQAFPLLCLICPNKWKNGWRNATAPREKKRIFLLSTNGRNETSLGLVSY